jgi:hypothetical protein
MRPKMRVARAQRMRVATAPERAAAAIWMWAAHESFRAMAAPREENVSERATNMARATSRRAHLRMV